MESSVVLPKGVIRKNAVSKFCSVHRSPSILTLLLSVICLTSHSDRIFFHPQLMEVVRSLRTMAEAAATKVVRPQRLLPSNIRQIFAGVETILTDCDGEKFSNRYKFHGLHFQRHDGSVVVEECGPNIAR